MNTQQIKKTLDTLLCQAPTMWAAGVYCLALDLATRCGESPKVESDLLYGSSSWEAFSVENYAKWCDDSEVVSALLCETNERERLHNADRPNGRETWRQVLARALYQAAALVLSLARMEGDYHDMEHP